MRLRSCLQLTFLAFPLFLSLPGLSEELSSQEHYTHDNTADSAQLRSFAKAYVEIDKIRKSYEPELSSTQNPRRAKEIEHEAIVRMNHAIVREGLTLETFTQIAEKANADKTLRQQINRLVEKEKNNS